LTTIDVSKNQFGDSGLAWITDFVRTDRQINVLKMNQCGFSTVGFDTFCEALITRYDEEVDELPEIKRLEVGKNGLGNNLTMMTSLLENRNCIIDYVNYEGNDMDDVGAGIWAACLKKLRKPSEEDKSTAKQNNKGASAEGTYSHSIDDMLSQRRTYMKGLCLKGNKITSSGAEKLASVLAFANTNEELKDKPIEMLDLRKNKIGLSGAMYFKKQFQKRQQAAAAEFEIKMKGKSNYGSWNPRHKFELKIMSDDVTPEGINQLFIGARQHEHILRRLYENGKEGPKKKLFHSQVNRPNYETYYFNTPGKNGDGLCDQYTIKISGENDDVVHGKVNGNMVEAKHDELFPCMITLYRSDGIVTDARGNLLWNKWMWLLVSKGYGCLVSNSLYRLGFILRYALKGKDEKSHSRLKSVALSHLKRYWNELMFQTSKASGGKTMFEWCLMHSKNPRLDIVRQFVNIFPVKDKYDVFLEQTIADGGPSLKEICLECSDPLVVRYAESKELICNRFVTEEEVYKSKFTRIRKVEDLFKTEENEDEDRFFYCRTFAATDLQRQMQLQRNEYDTHDSFRDYHGKYFEAPGIKIKDLIHVNINADLSAWKNLGAVASRTDKEHYVLAADRMAPTFTTPYKMTLRDLLDNTCLAGGEHVDEVRRLAHMVAYSLSLFNDRSWIPGEKLTTTDDGINNGIERKEEHLKLVKSPRIHGNLKPRNIVLRSFAEMPDLNSATDRMPQKWVLTDFSRSVPHGSSYRAANDSAYAPPELARRMYADGVNVTDEIEANEKIDVWAFGCVLFELLSGTSLFRMETRDDTILGDEERAELANWLGLDKDRLAVLDRACSDEKEEELIAQGKLLCQQCLQGRPEDRPTFVQIMDHPFLHSVNVGYHVKVKEHDELLEQVGGAYTSSWDNKTFLLVQSHVHLVNCNFDKAGVIVRSLKQQLEPLGCRMTTDEITEKRTEEWLKECVISSRIVLCLLTGDCFSRADVVTQLLHAEDFARKDERPDSKVMFMNVNTVLQLGANKWDKAKFSSDWPMTDGFQYLVKDMADKNPSFKKLSVSNELYDDPFDTWSTFLRTQAHGIFTTSLVETVEYYPQDYLATAAKSRVLRFGNLTPSDRLAPYSYPELQKSNYVDPLDSLASKMNKKDKPVYFISSRKEVNGKPRVYVLCGKGVMFDTKSAVAEIAQVLESKETDSLQSHLEEEERIVIDKVKTTFNLKKDSHVKFSQRETKYRKLKDKIKNVERKPGALVIVAVLEPGIFAKYGEFFSEALRTRKDQVIFMGVNKNWNMKGSKEVKEMRTYCTPELQALFEGLGDSLQPWFNRKETWQHEATLKELNKRVVYRIHRAPNLLQSFQDLEALEAK